MEKIGTWPQSFRVSYVNCILGEKKLRKGGNCSHTTNKKNSGHYRIWPRRINGGGYGAAPPSPMSFMVWNCRGLGNLRIRKELEVVVRAKDPSAVFLAETWVDEARLKEIKRNLDFENLFFVERNNKGRGLALY